MTSVPVFSDRRFTAAPRAKVDLAVPGVWRGDALAASPTAVQPTGWAALDRALPGGGWPSRALVELLMPQPAVLEWRLLGPALGPVAARQRPIVAIAPPQTPYLPGLLHAGLDERHFVWIRAEQPAERLWSAEQMIQSNACAAVIVWLPQVRAEQLRRLQLGAQANDGLVFVCRPESARHQPSAAPLRIWARHGLDWALQLHILKRRGPVLEEAIELPSLPGGLAQVITPRLQRPSRFFCQEAPAHAMDRPVRAPHARCNAAVQ